ncbi:MAG: tandem-95 repeat protein, partial [Desulfobacterales bacterium]|nr:tandem-95 repeat protein [Desulfobacterales bacterium]
VNEGSTTNLNLASNDTDADDGLDLASINIISGPTNGTIDNVNADGTVDYTHDGSETLSDSFTYTIDDLATATSNTVSVSLTISPVNDNDPVAGIDSITVNEGATITTLDGGATSVLANDTDNDLPNDLLTVSLDTNVSYGSLSLNADGTFSYTHDGSENFSDTFTYIVSDADGGATSTGTVSITINPINDNDPVATDDSITVDEGATITTLDGGATSVLANDNDTDLPNDSLSVALGIGPGNGALTLNSDGTFSYTHDGSENFSDAFTYIVSDADGGITDTGIVSISINPINENDPVITAGQAFSVSESAANGFLLGNADATDVDTATTLLGWTITGGNTGGVFAIDAATGEITVLNNTNLDFDTTPSYTLSLQVSDGTNSSAIQTVTINVTDVSSAITAGQSYLVSETDPNDTAVGTVLTTGDTPASFSITAGNTNSAFAIDNSGNITIADSSAIDYETLTNYTLTIEASDGTTPVSETVTITVTDINENTVGPVSDSDGATANSVAENGIVGDTVGITALATDLDATDTITYSLTDDAGGLFAIDSISGTITVANPLDFETATNHSVTVQATSSDSSTSSQAFIITITDVNEFSISSVIDSDGTVNSVAENSATDTAVGLSALATDNDGTDTVTYSLSDDAGGRFTIDSVTGVITVAGSLDYETAVNHSITVLATSSDTSTSSQTFAIAISNIDESSGTDPDPDPVTDPDTDPDPLPDPEPDPDPLPDTDPDPVDDPSTDEEIVTDPNETDTPDDTYVPPTTEIETAPVDEDIPVDENPAENVAVRILNSPDLKPNAEITNATETSIESDEQYLGYVAANSGQLIPQIQDSDEQKKQLVKHNYTSVLLQSFRAALHEASEFLISPLSATPIYMDTVDMNAIMENPTMRGQLEILHQEMDESFEESAEQQKTVVYAVSGVSATFAAGVVSYLLRAGSLMTSFLATMPIWKGFDPVSILITPKEKSKKDKKTKDIPSSENASDQTTESMFTED